MAGKNSTVRRRRVGLVLRRLREGAELSCEEVGEKLGWSGSKVSRIETGRVTVSQPDVERLLDLYGRRDPAERDELLALVRQASQKGWWQAYGDALSSPYATYIGLEAEATTIRTYEAQLVSGLLQTAEYARAVMRAATPTDSADEIEQRAAVRMARQALLTRDDSPHLWAVLDEAVLRRPVGGREVMGRQLRHLVQAVSLPNVTLQVLPFDAGAHAAMEGAFSILDFPEDAHPDVVYLEEKTTGAFLEDPEEIAGYSMAMEYLRAVALGPDQSVEFITAVAEAMTSSS